MVIQASGTQSALRTSADTHFQVLMNLLIGVMCNSMARAVEYEDIKALLSRAQVLDELDTVLPRWLERLMPHNYPQFVVSPSEALGVLAVRQ